MQSHVFPLQHKSSETGSLSAHFSLATITSLISHHIHTRQLCLFSYGKPRTGSLEHRNFNHVELANEELAPMLGKTRIPPGVLRMC